MGIVKLILKTNPIYLGKELIVSYKEEESIFGAMKKVAKETLLDSVPPLEIAYEMGNSQGRIEGKKEGYINASSVYEDKFREQSNLFLSQKQLFESQLREYNAIMDEYEIRIAQYEMQFGIELNEMSSKEKDDLLKLYVEQRQLTQLKNVKVEKIPPKIDINKIKEIILTNFNINDSFHKTYNQLKDLDKVNEKMSKYKDECVFYYDSSFVGNVFDKHKHGIVFGIYGMMFMDFKQKYIRYEDIVGCEILYVPPALLIKVNNDSNIVCEGIDYAQTVLVDEINKMRNYSHDGYMSLIKKEEKQKINTVLKKSLESAWKMSDYPGELIVDENVLKEWYDEYSVLGGLSKEINDFEMIAKFRHNYFTVIFTTDGFAFENEKKYIYILYKNIKNYKSTTDVFHMELLDDSVIEIDKVNTKFLNLTFKRIMEFYGNKKYYEKSHSLKELSYEELEAMETKNAP